MQCAGSAPIGASPNWRDTTYSVSRSMMSASPICGCVRVGVASVIRSVQWPQWVRREMSARETWMLRACGSQRTGARPNGEMDSRCGRTTIDNAALCVHDDGVCTVCGCGLERSDRPVGADGCGESGCVWSVHGSVRLELARGTGAREDRAERICSGPRGASVETATPPIDTPPGRAGKGKGVATRPRSRTSYSTKPLDDFPKKG